MRGKIPEESLKRIEAILEDFREENLRAPIIVEGKRDEDALRTLGFRGEIIRINSGSSLVSFAQRISMEYKRVIILTDWDRTGSFLAGRLYELLRDNDVLCDMEFRRKLGFYAGSLISTVEELPSIF